MNQLDQFEDQLRAMLHDRANVAAPLANESEVRRRVHRRRRQRQLVPAIGAAAAVAAAVTVGVVRQSDLDRTSTAAHTTYTSPRAPFDVPAGELPLVVMPGWSTARYDEFVFMPPEGRLAALAQDAQRKLLVNVGPVENFELPVDAEPVDISGRRGGVFDLGDDRHFVSWTLDDSLAVAVAATGVSTEQSVEFARGLMIDANGGVVEARMLPEGLALEVLPPEREPSHDAEYGFVNDTMSLQLHLYDGGRSGYEGRLGGDRRSAVTVLGREGSLLDYGNGRYRVNVLIGTHTWEFDGSPFGSVEEFLAAVDSIELTDRATWEQSIPAPATTVPAGTATAVPAEN